MPKKFPYRWLTAERRRALAVALQEAIPIATREQVLWRLWNADASWLRRVRRDGRVMVGLARHRLALMREELARGRRSEAKG